MSGLPSQFANSSKASLDAFIAAQSAALTTFEKLVALNVRVARQALDAQANHAQQALSVDNPQQAVALATAAGRPAADSAVGYTKEVYDLVSSLQTEWAAQIEAQVSSSQDRVASAIEQLSKYAPTGSEGAVSLLKNSLANATSAYDSFSKAAKQVADVASSNLAAASTAAAQSVNTAADNLAAAGKSATRAA